MISDGASDTRLGTVLSLLAADVPSGIVNTLESWPRWATPLPHVLACTSLFDRIRQAEQANHAGDASYLLDRAAAYLQVHARLAEARPLAERALAIGEASYGPNHPAVATMRANLAAILAQLEQR